MPIPCGDQPKAVQSSHPSLVFVVHFLSLFLSSPSLTTPPQSPLPPLLNTQTEAQQNTVTVRVRQGKHRFSRTDPGLHLLSHIYGISGLMALLITSILLNSSVSQSIFPHKTLTKSSSSVSGQINSNSVRVALLDSC